VSFTRGAVLVFAAALCIAPAPARTQSPQQHPDPLKHVALSNDVWFALGGTQRLRAEWVRNFLGGGPGVRDDDFGLSRTQVNVDLHLGSSLRLFAEGRHATVRSRELPGGARPNDRDELDWGSLWAEGSATIGAVHSSLRVGRQEIALGRERIFSPSDFSNVRRLFDAAMLNVNRDLFTLTAFYAHPVMSRPYESNRTLDEVDVLGVQGAWHRRNSAALLEAYVFNRDFDNNLDQRTTIGTRLLTPVFAQFQGEVELAFQFGTQGPSDARAHMLATDLTRTFATKWSPSLTAGFDWSSGTGRGWGPMTGTWDILYPLGHSYAGYADMLSRRNLMEIRGVAQASPLESLRLRASGHLFRRASLFDAAYDLGGMPFRPPAPPAGRDIGSEIDVTAQWRTLRYLRFDLGGARFFPGAYMRATGPAQTYTWAFASVAATY
jgi:hypothetical protein